MSIAIQECLGGVGGEDGAFFLQILEDRTPPPSENTILAKSLRLKSSLIHQLAFQDFIGAAAERAVASADLNPYLNRHLADAGVGTGGGGGTARAIHLPLWSEVNGTLAGSAAAGNAAAGADGFVNAVGGSSGAGQGGASNHISPSHPLLMGRSQANGNASRCAHELQFCSILLFHSP